MGKAWQKMSRTIWGRIKTIPSSPLFPFHLYHGKLLVVFLVALLSAGRVLWAGTRLCELRLLNQDLTEIPTPCAHWSSPGALRKSNPRVLAKFQLK